jgi:tetratricopeptide (TPR) repeat protein
MLLTYIRIKNMLITGEPDMKKALQIIGIIALLALVVLGIKAAIHLNYINQVNKAATIEELQALTDKYPDRAYAYFKLENYYAKSNNTEKQIKVLDKAISNVKNIDYKVHFSYEKSCADGTLIERRYNQAIEARMKYSLMIKYTSPYNEMLAFFLKQSGRYDEAIKVLSSFEREPDFCLPDFMQYVSFTGGIASMRSYLVSASPFGILVCKYFANFESYTVNNNRIAEYYFLKSDYDNALKYLDSKQDGCLAVKIYAAKGDFSNAEEYQQECIKDDALGYLQFKKKNYQEAENYFNKKEAPRNATRYKNLGMLYMEKGDYAKAAEYYKKALSFDYDYEAAYGLAKCYLKLDNKAEAVKYLKEVLSYNPDNKDEIKKLIEENEK